MYKFVVLASVFALTSAYGYGGGMGFGGAIYGPGPLAVHTRQSVAYIPTPSSGYAAPTDVVVDGQGAPVRMLFRTFSSPVEVNHVHHAGPGSFRSTASVDPPHVRVHTVTKPIIQQLNEIIAPQRLIRQQVLPVREQVQTIVARQAPVAVAPVALAPIGLARPVFFG